MKNNFIITVPEERLLHHIYIIRGKKVMLDKDLASLYGIETKRLKEQVRRNRNRFPADFMFELNKKEFENWRSQFATSNSEIMGMRHAPFAFTEHGILMLSSILNTDRAIKVNIRIMRIFIKMREMLHTHKALLEKLEQLEKKVTGHDDSIKLIFQSLRRFLQNQNPPRRRIGFRRESD
ncbi:MAG TPA: ORF6N domain-containing protein [Saprospiraceae bacterium]|nr:ORF6N domain-containing protein [Saprospiraceae bacterium]HZV43326.1 ORF6N domain-containing protein [Saprospiraceae bacterium]